MAAIQFPHTFETGRFKGRTFATQSEYSKACRETQPYKTTSPGIVKGDFVVRIVESFLDLQRHGVPTRDAIGILQKAVGA